MKEKEFQRSDRLSELVQAELARLLKRDIEDPRLKEVTITSVRITSDLGHARVYFTVLDVSKEKVDSALAAFRKATGYFRSHIAKTSKLRKVPSLSFYYDDTDDHGRRITKLINSIDFSGGDLDEKS